MFCILGFPYKAKNWELKARLAECEEWVTDLRAKCNNLEVQYNSNLEEVQEMRSFKEAAENERIQFEEKVEELNKKTESLENDLK